MQMINMPMLIFPSFHLQQCRHFCFLQRENINGQQHHADQCLLVVLKLTIQALKLRWIIPEPLESLLLGLESIIGLFFSFFFSGEEWA